MIQPVIKQLLFIEPVFGYLIQQFKIVIDINGDHVNTAAVGFLGGELTLFINPEYFKNLPFNERIGLLYHECCHVVLGHLSVYRKLNHKVANIAMDVEIDQKIPLAIRFSQPLIPLTVKPLNHMANNLDFMSYYDELMKNPEEVEKYQNQNSKESQNGKSGTPDFSSPMKDPTSKDEHLWLNNDISPEAVKMNVKIAVNLAYQQAKAGSGKISQEIESAIKNLLKPSKIDWAKKFEDLIGSVISNNRQSTRTRPNKKLGYLTAGEKDGNSPNLLFFVDVSGSHVNDLYVKSFNQIKKIVDDYQDDLKVFFFSDGVFDESILVNSSLKIAPKQPGTGGTTFDAIFEKANEFDDIEAIIILTDGDAMAPKKIPLKYRVIWGLTAGDRSYLTFGDKVVIED